MRIRVLTGPIGAMALVPLAALAQTPAPKPAFEVASIRTASLPTPEQFRSGHIHLGIKVDKAAVDIGAMSIADLLPYAFRVKAYQISGPAWMHEARWDISAKLPDGASPDQVPEMLQALLTDRFKLAVHREMRDLPVYELVAGKGGPKLEPAAAADEPAPAADGDKNPGPPGLFFGGFGGGAQANVRPNPDGRGAVITGGPMGTMKVSMGTSGGMHMEFSRITMPAFVDMLNSFLDKPVLDGTGLKGNYKIALELPMEAMLAMIQKMAQSAGFPLPGPGDAGRGGFGGPGGAPPGGPQGLGAALAAGLEPSTAPVFQAVQQLGLKLDSRKAPLQTIVVDHLEKTPTEN
jgi:uncharacterized protein (TIGR03435 family)